MARYSPAGYPMPSTLLSLLILSPHQVQLTWGHPAWLCCSCFSFLCTICILDVLNAGGLVPSWMRRTCSMSATMVVCSTFTPSSHLHDLTKYSVHICSRCVREGQYTLGLEFQVLWCPYSVIALVVIAVASAWCQQLLYELFSGVDSGTY